MGSKRIVAVLAAIFAAVLLISAPAALAGGKGSQKSANASDHDGDADSDSGTRYTEDNDTNDGGTPNNQPDEGDNEHPSGKDRSVENGGSGNQGNSESAPDEDGHGPERDHNGTDKPNGPGGVDLADQDGNNGCGNDDDFEDDNEGWCGGKPKDDNGGGGENPCVDDMNTPEDECDTGGGGGGGGGDDTTTGGGGGGDEVLGETLTRPASGTTPGTGVLGTSQERGGVAAATAALPFTGAALIPFVAMGFGLIGGGAALARKRSR